MMGGSETPWLPALVTLGVSAVGGFLAALALPKGPKRQRASGDNIGDLEERLSHLVAQLRDLDEQLHRLSPDAYVAQKSEMEGRATETLRALEVARCGGAASKRAQEVEAVAVSPVVAFLASRPQLRGALWGGGVVALGVLLYGLVTEQQRPQAAMGGVQAAPAGGAQAADEEEFRVLYERLQGKPDDLTALVRLSHLLLKSQMLDEAKVVNDRVLQLDPTNVEGRVHGAVLLAGTGDRAGAQKGLDDVLKKDPTFAEAWFFRGMFGMQAGKQELMRQSFEQFVLYAPDGPQKERIRAMLQRQMPAP